MESPRHNIGADPGVPLVSVIIPVHNRLQYLRQAVESALAQTHPAVEVIVVDDGSEVDLLPVVDRFGTSVRVLRQPNGGLASARNHGIAHASGKYLSFLDDDDFLEPHAIEELLTAMASCSGAQWAAGRYYYVDEHGRRLPCEHRCRFQSGNVYRHMIRNNLMGAPSAVLVSVAAMRTLGGFDPAPCYHMAEDYDLWMSLARRWPLAATQRKVTNYRIHSGQFTQRQAKLHTQAVLAVLQKQWALSPPVYEQDFRRSIARVHFQHGDTLYVSGEHRAARAHWRRGLPAISEIGCWGVCNRFLKSWLPIPALGLLRRMFRPARLSPPASL